MVFLDSALSPVLQPLLNSSPFIAILVLALALSVIITFVYKWVTNQELMKELKTKQKDYQKEMKELRSKPEEMMKVQKEAMKLNMQYMKQSFKPTLITMIPILIIFGWMAGHLTYEPIYPGETYSVTALFAEGVTGDAELIVSDGTEIISESIQQINSGVTWNVKSDEGEHLLTVKTKNIEQSKKVLITTEVKYAEPLEVFDHSDIEKIQINQNKLKPLGTVSIFGWQPGWLGLYIIFSIVFSMGLRKLLKLY
ncbi:DUF106 domain-containing protein [Candidatus Woesearchaeota archaeon]|jgi:uncharacterized membrane protein (DUF106 family)|nr:DUF106 domain-containing protein [Candidatus Woesearchaeota archaeon]MBT5397316.1 DUF106 domain-containing protein [Candidatus Woesearchaeota archaeon]MBT5924797.1 DUF106 domain-containing protein [Candidatus Woesearchaeota archaeon]MBT6367839.1 DUF106 domain-containing protein [Candidatus Woesearchaeota archaeon]MBT7762716.1 DUF106 domain-containing protein [Candidatus Woesearchaeota archaeon]